MRVLLSICVALVAVCVAPSRADDDAKKAELKWARGVADDFLSAMKKGDAQSAAALLTAEYSRSLAGNRDSEIAQGSYQPAHLNGPCGGRARGFVHGFRMSLWYEHFTRHVGGGGRAAVFAEPESVECVRAVRRAAEALWDAYTRDRVEDLPGHLLPFPISVSEFGEVSDLPAGGCFPDTRAPVKGRKSAKLPAILTT